jgi:DNA-binding MarR family transcriptional regulator
MTEKATSTSAYRFGDLLALTRQAWVRRMAGELGARGYNDYRITDAASMRLLLAGPVSLGHIGGVFGVTRQAARKVVRGLEQRGYATTEADAADARKIVVVATSSGFAYSRAIRGAITSLNRSVAESVSYEQLVAADVVLRAAIEDEQLRCSADRIPAP